MNQHPAAGSRAMYLRVEQEFQPPPELGYGGVNHAVYLHLFLRDAVILVPDS